MCVFLCFLEKPRRTLFITYLDDDIIIARDDSGAPDLLIRKEKVCLSVYVCVCVRARFSSQVVLHTTIPHMFVVWRFDTSLRAK